MGAGKGGAELVLKERRGGGIPNNPKTGLEKRISQNLPPRWAQAGA